MRNHVSKLTLALAALAVLSLAPSAFASTMTYNGIGLHQNVTVHASGTLADGKTLAAGQLLITYEGVDYAAYCVDLDHYVGTAEVTELSAQTLNNGNLAAYLFDTYADAVTTGLEAAALGTAIWEVIYETTTDPVFNVGTGFFTITGNASVAAAANTLLSGMNHSYVPDPWPTVLHSTKQDVMIPEPATLAMLSVAGLGLIRRRRRAAL